MSKILLAFPSNLAEETHIKKKSLKAASQFTEMEHAEREFFKNLHITHSYPFLEERSSKRQSSSLPARNGRVVVGRQSSSLPARNGRVVVGVRGGNRRRAKRSR
ncbi:hypothetical protein SLEP1_g23076 [Rubroshorea leprosula]|uniref:Uncharacterized protein n=1 Tax=Rubroshorea leprosula TaxID=152421 RepID=A0AAV5JB42_9ROSI|nr:hypothetical protein SLEP1_g23076 [Rubroshorea leprosula]